MLPLQLRLLAMINFPASSAKARRALEKGQARSRAQNRLHRRPAAPRPWVLRERWAVLLWLLAWLLLPE